jgi:hypothetical protein
VWRLSGGKVREGSGHVTLLGVCCVFKCRARGLLPSVLPLPALCPAVLHMSPDVSQVTLSGRGLAFMSAAPPLVAFAYCFAYCFAALPHVLLAGTAAAAARRHTGPHTSQSVRS